MLTRRRISICLIAALGVAAAAWADSPRVLNSRTIVLAVDSEPHTKLELHVSTDQRRTWKLVPCEALSAGTVAFRAEADGLHDFFFVARAADGATSPLPTPGCLSHSQVLVDTLPPILQVREVLTSEGSSENAAATFGARVLRIRATVVDQNASDAGVRIFFRRSGSDRWLDGGTHKIEAGQVQWTAPSEVGEAVDLHIIARDQAGNTAGVELLEVRLNAPSQADGIVASTSREPRLAAEATGEPPLKARPGSRDWIETAPVASQPARESPAVRSKASETLREQAARFMGEGRYALAAARFEEALRQAPADQETLLDLADARFWLGEYETAEALFERGHATEPQAVRPLEGLALLAATRQRFGEARERLEALVKIDPGNAEFRIRLGDMRLRAGDERGARELWQALAGEAGQPPAIRDKAQRRLSKLLAPP